MSSIEPETHPDRHEPVVTSCTDTSLIHDSAFIANTATVLGQVEIGPGATVWFGAIMRGDTEKIVIGKNSNVQDACVLHCDPGTPCIIGDNVTIGHGAIVHGAIVEDDALIGIRATILNGAKIGRGAIVAANALVTENAEIPAGMLAMGSPAKVVKPVSDALQERMREGAAHYVDMGRRYKEAFGEESS